MIAYPRTGDYPEALVKILLTVMEKTPDGGATLANELGVSVQVLEPLWLREAIVSSLEQALKLYE